MWRLQWKQRIRSNRIKCGLLESHTLQLPDGHRARNLQKIRCSETLAGSIVAFKTIPPGQRILYSSSAEVFQKRLAPQRALKVIPPSLLSPANTCLGECRCHVTGGSDDTFRWKDEFLKARTLAKIYLPWYHQFTSLITLIIIVNNKIQSSLVLNYIDIGTR